MNNDNFHDQPRSHWPAPRQLVIGILFITLGAIFLVAQVLGRWFITDFWPVFLIAGGLVFYAAYFLRELKPPGYEGLLFPGTYIMVLGILFLFMNLISWHAMRYLWPTFLFGVAISLGAMYRYGPKDNRQQRKDIISTAKILTIISLVLYLVAAGGLRLWPLILIIVGIVIILKGLTKKGKTRQINEE
jgi:hypothetical protein